MRKWHCIVLVVLLALVPPRATLAHPDDYIGETFVYQTLPAGEKEVEYWLDAGRNSDRGQNFLRHNFATEFAITDHWMFDARATGIQNFGDGFDFDSGRFETRYRFFEENTLPIDIAISAEVNTERADDGSVHFGLEPRLILSKDVGPKLNLTLNLQENFPLSSAKGSSASAFGVQRIADRPSFDPAFGFRYNFSDSIRAGAELKYNFEAHEGVVVPQLWFKLPHETTVKLGVFLPFDENRETFFRVALEFGF